MDVELQLSAAIQDNSLPAHTTCNFISLLTVPSKFDEYQQTARASMRPDKVMLHLSPR